MAQPRENDLERQRGRNHCFELAVSILIKRLAEFDENECKFIVDQIPTQLDAQLERLTEASASYQKGFEDGKDAITRVLPSRNPIT